MKTARALPLLMYHHISPSPGLVTLSPENFRGQMAWLARNGWRTIGADDLAAFLSGKLLREKCLMLTFDDGWLDNWLYAHPILQEFGLNAVLFLITGWLAEGSPRALRRVGTGETATNSIAAMPAHRVCMEKVKTGQADDVMLRWSEVRAMRAAGTFEFHSHTHTHTRWDKLVGDPSERAARLAEDLAASRRSLQEHLGEVSGHLCWPQGFYDADWQGRAQAAGFTHLYTVMPGTCTPDTAADAIPRIVVKDRNAGWLARRLWLYRQPALTRAYLAVQGKSAA